MSSINRIDRLDLSRCGLATCAAWLPISRQGERVVFGFTFECGRCGSPILAEGTAISSLPSQKGQQFPKASPSPRRMRGIMAALLPPLLLASASMLAACGNLETPETLNPADRGEFQGYGATEPPAPPPAPPPRLVLPPANTAPQASDAEAQRRLDDLFRSWMAERQAATPPATATPLSAPPSPDRAAAPPAVPPAPHSPPPDAQAKSDSPPEPATIDARPPGSQCGYWQLCNLWE
jgi:hypothetical protein